MISSNILSKGKSHVDSYYAATQIEIDSLPILTQDIDTETCIIGGGYAGLMTALSLLERGHRDFVLLEQNRIGWGASGRNGGFVFGGYSLGPRALVNQVGEKRAKELYELTTGAVDLIRRRINRYQIHCDLVDQGVIWANWFKNQELLHRESEMMRSLLGVEWEYISPETLQTQIKTQRYKGGLFEKNAMHFHPLNYALGIAELLHDSGGLIFENTPVLDINYAGPEKIVTSSGGVIRCKNVVIAGGGYIGDLCPPVAHSILPIATYVAATAPLGCELPSILNTQSAIYDNRFAFDYYRPLKDTRLLWGGRISANTKTPVNLEALLRQDIGKVFPQIEDIPIDYLWDGWMGYARHQMAQIGQLRPGVWYSIGFGGHGVAPTTMAGEIVASAICEQDQRYRWFAPWGLPWNGGVFGPMAAQTSYWWYQLKDWLRENLEK